MADNPLGNPVDYVTDYDPALLHGIARAEARGPIGIGAILPFRGEDIWNAWELGWLDASGKPVVATAAIRFPADSPRIVESKSLKLYLGSFAMTRTGSAREVADIIRSDLSLTAGRDVSVLLDTSVETGETGRLPGICIDDLDALCDFSAVSPACLSADDSQPVSEELYSHLLRSLCPVTGQPDTGSVLVRYSGPQIDRATLLQYIVSFRSHNDFHEACVERMFMDLRKRCGTAKLTVYARYNRRGGLDISPWRSDFESTVDNMRLWRQ
jgi:7-cyano-7-deazaguanine reductase